MPERPAAPASGSAPDWYKPVRKGVDAFVSTVESVPVPDVRTMVKNAPGNAVNIASGLYNTVRHPVNTLYAMKDYLGGAAEATRELTGKGPSTDIPEEQRRREAAAFAPTRNTLAESYRHPLGVPGRIVNYLNAKPLDAAMWASGGLGTAGKVAGAAGATRPGVWLGARVPGPLARFVPETGTLARAAEVTNPVTGAAKAAGRGLPAVRKATSRLATETLGTTTGTGRGAVEEALEGGQAFSEALRGKISGEQVVEHAKGALQTIRDKRGAVYRAKLDEITKDPVVYFGIKDALDTEMNRLISPDNYNIPVKQGPKGMPVFSFKKTVIKKGENLVRGALTDIAGWTDTTPKGLDVLKKRLSDYIDQAGIEEKPAKALLTRLEKTLDGELKKEIPGYTEMTKGYAEVTNLIKDIEESLALGPSPLRGRLTADKTLRKLTSALRENFEMRRDLLDALSAEGGADVSGQVAGYAMSQVLPRGLIGKGLGAGSLGWAATHLHPSMLPVLAASSPRLMGEFLMAYGKAMRATEPVRRAAGKVATAATRPLPAAGAYAVGKARGDQE